MITSDAQHDSIALIKLHSIKSRTNGE